MSVPAPIGKIHYNEPRAVMVREPEDLKSVHSAIHGAVNIYVDSHAEAEKVIDAWNQIMNAVAQEVNKILVKP